jgi:hypothetical protein
MARLWPARADASRRVMKARTDAAVSGCGHYVLTGRTIVMVDGKWWCAPCILAQIAAATAVADRSAS